MHETCTGTKKQKFWNTCTGTKKNFRGIVATSQVVFLSLCRFGALWSSKCLFFLSLCRLRAPWSSKPNAFLHVYCDIISNVCKLLCFYLQCWLPMQLFEESGAFFMQRACNLNINLSFLGPDSGFGKLEFFPFEILIYLKSFAFRIIFFTGICNVCNVYEHVIIFTI